MHARGEDVDGYQWVARGEDPYSRIVRISAYTNQSRVSHSVRMRENSAEEYPKQSSLERSF